MNFSNYNIVRRYALKFLFLMLILIFSYSGNIFAQSGEITLDHVDGLIAPDTIIADLDSTITFHIRFHNNTGLNIVSSGNGFRIYSPTGANWNTTLGTPTGTVTSEMYENGIYVNTFSITGSGADTVGFGGFKLFKSGIPDGFNEIAWTIEIGPIDPIYHGDQICLDSSFYPPSLEWKWQTDDPCGEGDQCQLRFPTWDGPHCFTIYDCTIGMDTDNDGIANICDTDDDNDGINDDTDNCPLVPNPGQDPAACAEDYDSDGFADVIDNCPNNPNPLQEDADNDGVGDVCDNCVSVANSDQLNSDTDLYGDACDNCDSTDNNNQQDSEGDGVGDACDNCPQHINSDQLDTDKDSIGDMCDNCPSDSSLNISDFDHDEIGDICDNCEFIPNNNQIDTDNDGFGDECDYCVTIPSQSNIDSDSDGLGYDCDNCPDVYNSDQKDSDLDGVGDKCDNCPTIPNPNQENNDNDEWGNLCDLCPDDSGLTQDMDGDMIGNICDNCPEIYNPEQTDSNNDGIGDACATDVDDDRNFSLPDKFKLSQNYPNPFNAGTLIRYALPKSSHVKISVFNILGQEVKELINQEQPAGYYQLIWEGDNNSGVLTSSGVYFYKMDTIEGVFKKKMIMLK